MNCFTPIEISLGCDGKCLEGGISRHNQEDIILASLKEQRKEGEAKLLLGNWGEGEAMLLIFCWKSDCGFSFGLRAVYC